MKTKKILITVPEELGHDLKLWSAKMKTTQMNLIRKMLQAGVNNLNNAEKAALDSYSESVP